MRLEVSGREGDLVHPIVNRRPTDLGRSRYWALDARGRRTLLGTVSNGGLHRTGVVPADGLLKPFPLARALPAGTVAVLVESTGDLQLDALLVQPGMSTVRYDTASGRPACLYVNASTAAQTATALAPGSGATWDAQGHREGSCAGPSFRVAGGGFAITR